MPLAPRVSIVMPLFNDEHYVSAALDSCLAQTLRDIEIICVDDASTDRTAAIVADYQRRDPRIRLLRHDVNRSAFQARRTGIEAAAGNHVLFLDGDDELDPRAAHILLSAAETSGADLVGCGVEVVASDGGVPTRMAAALQPRDRELVGAAEIVSGLFPAGEPAQGHLWRFLFATSLLVAAYAGVPLDHAFYRANDLPITFLAATRAHKYVSTPERLYRYHFRRGTSGHPIDSVEHFRFLLSGVEPITSIAAAVAAVGDGSPATAAIGASYESARLHIIANVLRACLRDTSGDLQARCLMLLVAAVGELDALRAAAAFCPEALSALSRHTDEPSPAVTPVRSVLLSTRHLNTGGLQAVLLRQAAELAATGYTVTIAVQHGPAATEGLPAGVSVREISGNDLRSQIDHFVDLCRDRDVDLIIDHHILYNEKWPWFALAALSIGTPTVGWVHNFALRPLFDGTERVSFLTTHARVLRTLVTLSPTDVAFWKLRGVPRTVYLPNPPSPIALAALAADARVEPPSGRIELAWWGRLNNSTKQVLHLIDVARHLRDRGVDFRLTIIGPDTRELTGRHVRDYADEQRVTDSIELIGELNADELLESLAPMHLLVSTSAIEGFQLTIVEAQALGMPVVMYDLPWLTTVRDNAGVVTTAPGDAGALADAVTTIVEASDSYTMLSQAAREFAQRTAAVDTHALLVALLDDELPAEYSPAPTLEDARILIDWSIRIAERSVREKPDSRSEVATLRRERDRAQSKLHQITSGPSFRVGRALTLLPRRIVGLARPRPRPRPSVSDRASAAAGPSAPPPLRAAEGRQTPARVSSPDVTFVIPVFNAALWLDDCLSSVLAQTGVDVEVICINDGSTDGSSGILQRFAADDARVTVIDQANSGQSVGRNRGLAAAAGRYVIYLDSDDYWPDDVLAALVRRADADQLDALLFDCTCFRDGDIDDKTWKWYASYYQRGRTYRPVRRGVELMAAMRRNKDYRPHVGLYIARTAFLRDLDLQFIPGIVHQDNPYTFRMLLHAERAAHEPTNAYARRIRPGSTITSLTPDRSARGYYLSYLDMIRELDRSAVPTDSAAMVSNIVDYVYDGARKQFALISDEAADGLRELDDSPGAQRVWASLRAGDDLAT